jgi:hypothetical protein
MNHKTVVCRSGSGAAERIRTFDRLVNSQPLYRAEPRRQSIMLLPLLSFNILFKVSRCRGGLFYLSDFVLRYRREALVELFGYAFVPFVRERHIQQAVHPVKIMLSALDQKLLM